MVESDAFLGIRFGESFEAAHNKMSLQGFKFIAREKADEPIGRVLYKGLYRGMESHIHLEFLRNGFHRSRVEIILTGLATVDTFQQDLSRKFGPSEKLTRSRQACSDDSPQDPCFTMWSVDDDTSIILDVAGSDEKPLMILEYFRIL